MSHQTLIETSIDPMIPQPFVVKESKEETHDTFTLVLEAQNGQRQRPFEPGQFNMLYLFGVGEVPISISGNPNEEEVTIHTIRAVGTVTKAMRRLKEGDVVGVRGPFGSGWPVEKVAGKDVVIVTGGIGLAPLRPAIYHVLSRRKEIGKVALLYGARTPEDILYIDEIGKWRSQLDLQVRITVDKADDHWFGTVGVVTILIPKARFDPSNTIAMICGPEIMMHFTVTELLNLGMCESNIYVSMERNMKCAVGFCGHCQYGPTFICKDGAVFPYSHIKNLFRVREV